MAFAGGEPSILVFFRKEIAIFGKLAFSAKFARGSKISAKMNGFEAGFERDFGRRYTFWRLLGGLGAHFWLHFGFIIKRFMP